jgi:hypothetical protein
VSTPELDLATVLSVLFTLPLVAVVVAVVVDVLGRPDLSTPRKVVYVAIVVLVVPAALLYLLSRPTSVVRHHDRARPDWRADLLDHLEAPAHGRPAVGPARERELRDRIAALRGRAPS